MNGSIQDVFSSKTIREVFENNSNDKKSKKTKRERNTMKVQPVSISILKTKNKFLKIIIIYF
jgi:hypothetical protein